MGRYSAKIDEKLNVWAVFDAVSGVFIRHFMSKAEAEDFASWLNEFERAICEAEKRRDALQQEMIDRYVAELKRMEEEYRAMLQRFGEAYQENIRLMEKWSATELRRIDDLAQQDSGPSPS